MRVFSRRGHDWTDRVASDRARTGKSNRCCRRSCGTTDCAARHEGGTSGPQSQSAAPHMLSRYAVKAATTLAGLELLYAACKNAVHCIGVNLSLALHFA